MEEEGMKDNEDKNGKEKKSKGKSREKDGMENKDEKQEVEKKTKKKKTEKEVKDQNTKEDIHSEVVEQNPLANPYFQDSVKPKKSKSRADGLKSLNENYSSSNSLVSTSESVKTEGSYFIFIYFI